MARGDFLVVRSTGWAARLIQIGTRSRWNHAAIDVGNGQLVEANPNGVQRKPVTEYGTDQYVTSRLELTDSQRDDIVAYAVRAIGTPYGWVDIVALALVAVGIRPGWLDRYAARTDRLVCSQLVAYAYAAAGCPVSSADPWTVTPGDLADVLLEATRTTTQEGTP